MTIGTFWLPDERPRWNENVAIALGALIWLWPVTHGPLPQFWPNWVAWVCAVAIVFVLKESPCRTPSVIAGWLVAAAVSAVLAVLQYLDLGHWLSSVMAAADPGHGYANTRQSNHLASLLAVGMAVLVWCRQTGRLVPHSWWLGLLLATGLATTASRGGALQMLVVCGLGLYWSRNAPRKIVGWLASLVVTYIAATSALPWLLQTFHGLEGERNFLDRWAVENTCSSRKILWSNVLDIIQRKPWTGWGWGNLGFASYDTLHDGMRFCTYFTNAHNLPLHLAAEFGIPIAILFSVSLCTYALYLRPWNLTEPTPQLATGILMVLGLHSLLEFPLWFGNFQSMLGFLIWICWSGRHAIKNLPPGPISLSTRNRNIIGFFLSLYLIVLAWDYTRISQLYLPYAERLGAYKNDTVEKVKSSIFHKDQVIFALVVATDPDSSNAEVLLNGALQALHISPEPRIIERVIVSASILGRQDLVDYHTLRYQANWPTEYRKWLSSQKGEW